MVGRLQIFVRIQSLHVIHIAEDMLVVGLDLISRGDTHVGDSNRTNEVHKVVEQILFTARLIPP